MTEWMLLWASDGSSVIRATGTARMGDQMAEYMQCRHDMHWVGRRTNVFPDGAMKDRVVCRPGVRPRGRKTERGWVEACVKR